MNPGRNLPRPMELVYVCGDRIPLPAYVREVSPDGQTVRVSTHDEPLPLNQIRMIPKDPDGVGFGDDERSRKSS